MTRLPGAIFIVDIKRENIAVKEAQKLNIPIFAMVDTNSDPRKVDFVIPSNDDASKSIDKVISLVTNAISEGLSERKLEKEAEAKETEIKEAEVKEAEVKEAEVKEAEVKEAEVKEMPKTKVKEKKITKTKEKTKSSSKKN